MGQINDHLSTVSHIERYIGTPYDKTQALLDNLPQLLELLAYFRNNGTLNDARFHYAQALPSAVWSIYHGLQKFPSVETVDSNLEEMEGEVTHVDADNITITFNQPVSGFAYIN